MKLNNSQIQKFIQSPNKENWNAVMNLLRTENFTPFVSDGQLGLHMNRHVQNMGDASQNQIVDNFFNFLLEILNGMDIDWNDFV